jgi:hypothetical protein
MVVDGGRAVVVVLQRFPVGTAYLVRIAEDALARVVSTLRTGPGADALIGAMPAILGWPDSASSVEP